MAKTIRLALFAVIVLIGGCATAPRDKQWDAKGAATVSFDVPSLLASYKKNNQPEVPLVSYMTNGLPKVLV